MQNGKNKQFVKIYKYDTKIKNKFNAALLFIMCLLLFLPFFNFFYVTNDEKPSLDAVPPPLEAIIIVLPDPSEYGLDKDIYKLTVPAQWGEVYYQSDYSIEIISVDYWDYWDSSGSHYGESLTIDIPFEELNKFYGRIFKITYNNVDYNISSNAITFSPNEFTRTGIFLYLKDCGALIASNTITYLDQGGGAFSGTLASGSPTSYDEGIGATLLSPTRAGYDFVGWYDNVNCAGNPITEISASDSGDKTFYAKWKIQTITITLNGTIYGENYMLYVYKGNAICKQIYVDAAQYTFELDWVSNYNKDYKLAFVFGCYGNLTFAAGSSANSNITTSNRTATILTLADTTLSFTLANPRINSTIII